VGRFLEPIADAEGPHADFLFFPIDSFLPLSAEATLGGGFSSAATS